MKWQMIVSFGDERSPFLVAAGPGSRDKPIEIDDPIGNETALAAEKFLNEIGPDQGDGGWNIDDLPVFIIPIPAELLRAETYRRVASVVRVGSGEL